MLYETRVYEGARYNGECGGGGCKLVSAHKRTCVRYLKLGTDTAMYSTLNVQNDDVNAE